MTGADPANAIRSYYAARAPARLGVAVSGGSDSLALLVLLAEWGKADLLAATVDHGLRPDSASEALHVARICEARGIPHSVLAWDGWDGRGNLQAEARRTRYALLAAWGRERGLDAVAVGHTADDQAETVLMRLARGPGVDGLSAMPPRMVRDGMEFHRPLLGGVRRADLRAVLADRGLRWAEDPSNEDTAFERVRARQTLDVIAPLGIETPALTRTAAQLAEARFALNWAAAEAARDIARTEAGDLVFDRAAFRRLPRELQRRLLSHGLDWIAGAGHPPRRGALSDALDAIGAQANTALHGCRLLCSAMTVRLTRELAAVDGTRTATDALWDNRWKLEGPHAPGLEVRALGEALSTVPGWRETKLPRATLLAGPAIWRGEELVAAPLAGLSHGWRASAPSLDDFTAFIMTR